MRILLHEKFDWRVPNKRAVVSFEIGEHTMKREAGEEAVRLGKGREVASATKPVSTGAAK